MWKPIQRLVLLLTILWMATSVNGQLNHHTKQTEDHLSENQEKLSQATLENDSLAIYEALKGICDHYNTRGVWDSTYYYFGRWAEICLPLGKYEDYLRCIGDMRFINGMLGRRDTTLHQNLMNTIPLIYREDIEVGRRGEMAWSIATHCDHGGMPDSAIKFQKLAIEYVSLSDRTDINRVNCRVQLAEYYRGVNNTAKVLGILLETKPLVDRSIIPAMSEIQFYNFLCRALVDVGDTIRAREYALNNLSLIEEEGFDLWKGSIYDILEDIEIAKKNYSVALQYLDLAYPYLKRDPEKQKWPWTHCEYAILNVKLNRLGQAKLHIDTAQSFRHLFKPNLQLYFNYVSAVVAQADGDLPLLKSHIDSIETKYLPLAKSEKYLLQLKYLYHRDNGEEGLALKYFIKKEQYEDSVRSIRQALLTKQIESEFQRELQDVEIKSLTETNYAKDKSLAVRNTALILGGAMLLILLSLLYGLYRLYSRNQENQLMLAAQNDQISQALADNKMLIKEIHHRVKNNLQVISSLLSMQARKVNDDETKSALNTSKTRVQSMSILHQNLYQGEHLKDVEVDKYLGELIENIKDTYQLDKQIQFTLDIDSISMDVDVLVPLGLIANELVSNATKYAFKGKTNGNIHVSFKEKEEVISLQVTDDGVGIGADEIPRREGSLGARIIHSFSRRLDGEVIVRSSNQGTSITIDFPKSSFYE